MFLFDFQDEGAVYKYVDAKLLDDYSLKIQLLCEMHMDEEIYYIEAVKCGLDPLKISAVYSDASFGVKSVKAKKYLRYYLMRAFMNNRFYRGKVFRRALAYFMCYLHSSLCISLGLYALFYVIFVHANPFILLFGFLSFYGGLFAIRNRLWVCKVQCDGGSILGYLKKVGKEGY